MRRADALAGARPRVGPRRCSTRKTTRHAPRTRSDHHRWAHFWRWPSQPAGAVTQRPAVARPPRTAVWPRSTPVRANSRARAPMASARTPAEPIRRVATKASGRPLRRRRPPRLRLRRTNRCHQTPTPRSPRGRRRSRSRRTGLTIRPTPVPTCRRSFNRILTGRRRRRVVRGDQHVAERLRAERRLG